MLISIYIAKGLRKDKQINFIVSKIRRLERMKQ